MLSPVEQIKEKLSIVEVLSSYLKLEKAGANFKALCPFHSEKTPSFHISPARNAYYCFGCGEKGDIFSFVEKFEGLDFRGALRLLGERAGVSVVFERQETRDERDRLHSALEEATLFFEKNLTEDARTYLTKRGLSVESLTEWRIGYAQNDWRTLLSHLRSRGYTDSECERAGLVKRPENAPGKDLYDRFRSRIMFPLCDSAGRVIAFSGRIFPNDDTAAKYLNSPETELFSKSKILFGFDKAKNHIRKANFSILVEGQMDVVLTHQAGFKNAIALSGTALSSDHLLLLSRLSNRLVIALDADNAGISSAGKGAKLALSLGFDVKVARLPAGLDPADLILKDADAFRGAVREAKHIIDFYLAVLKERFPDERAYRLEVEKTVVPYLREIKSAIDQAHFVSQVATALRIPEDPIWKEVREGVGEPLRTQEERVREEEKTLSRRESLIQHLYGLLLWQENIPEPALSPSTIREKMEELLGASLLDVSSLYDDDKEKLIFVSEMMAQGAGSPSLYFAELARNLEEDILKTAQIALSEKLKNAEREGNEAEVTKLSQEHHALSEKLKTVRSRPLS